MKRTLPLFSYRHSDSLVHKIPAWVKLLVLMIVTLRIFSNATFGLEEITGGTECIKWARTGFYFLITMFFFFAARTPFRSLFRLRFILWLGLCMVIVSLCSVRVVEENGAYFYSLNTQMLKDDGIYIARFFTTALLALVVFETTSKIQIMDTLSSIENAVCKVIPSFKKLHLALILSITITFIPEIFSSWNRINMAAAARTPLNRKGRRSFSLNSLNAQFTALFMNMLQYAEQVRRAVENRM